MGRIGIRHENAWQLFDAFRQTRNCELCGVFSHFATSHQKEKRFTALQLERFLEAMEYFPQHDMSIPTRHIANSAAVLQHPGAVLDMVRPGIMLYGVYPGPEVERTVSLRPVLSMKTRVVYFKVVMQDASIGYDHTWTAARDTRVVTLPVGYGDGYTRGLSNKAQVLIGGRRHALAGRISMDQCMVDIGAASAYTGDEVVLIGAQGDDRISVEELASISDTIPYEVLTLLSTRVPRSYIAEKT
ncbi:MAG: alanine racemase, partial [Bacteroidetes bacterium]|nr:alanine racemase [Bacteroidota bacterium]